MQGRALEGVDVRKYDIYTEQHFLFYMAGFLWSEDDRLVGW